MTSIADDDGDSEKMSNLTEADSEQLDSYRKLVKSYVDMVIICILEQRQCIFFFSI